MRDGDIDNHNGDGDGAAGGSKKHKKNKKKKKSRGRKTITPEQLLALKEVYDWAFPDSTTKTAAADDFLVSDKNKETEKMKVVFELHSHSTCSDGFLSPAALVERAHKRGVKVLALTDHDTMAGISDAMDAARKYGIRIIPGVEISAIFHPRKELGSEEPVHILAYYSSSGPSRSGELEHLLSTIREGRYLRGQNMLLKLNKLKVPIKWEQVVKIAGNGVAPGRLHVARAMVEAGHVENMKQAFTRYLYDGGPAYATGNEPRAEDAIQLIVQTGGLAVLAHPWALKNPIAVISSLKSAGLHAVEVYRRDGKLAAFSDLCDKYNLLKLGGSDYHGRGERDEPDLGSVSLPVSAVFEFLKIARPVWFNAIKDMINDFTYEPTLANLDMITRYAKKEGVKETSFSCTNATNDIVDSYLSSFLTNEERHTVEFKEICLKLSGILVDNKDLLDSMVSHQ